MISIYFHIYFSSIYATSNANKSLFAIHGSLQFGVRELVCITFVTEEKGKKKAIVGSNKFANLSQFILVISRTFISDL